MTCAETAFRDEPLNRGRQLEEPEGIGYSHPAPAHLVESCSWVKLKSSMSCWYAAASSSGLSSSRLMFSISACSKLSDSEALRTIAGTVANPARLAARQRLSPAINSY